eukprot:TRINITY_DN2862_c0_g1_i1.p1 TRINITY_DN2862_c0_g1~~TRINITY_DN2862_c0_g1_i1.p1  ORF type:complete len:218 (+),score=5.38 TRINITY_DN2862_c0_g1_i1:63-716(+)
MEWFFELYSRIPIITKIYVTLAVLTSLAVTFEFVTAFTLYLNWRLILQKWQWWRLITCFLYFDRISVHLFFNLHFLYAYSRKLEEHFYHRQPAGFLHMILIGAFSLLGITWWMDNQLFLGNSLSIMIVYVWSRRFPDESLNLFGLVTCGAPYLAWVLCGFSALFGGTQAAIIDIIGIGVGHVFWYLQDIVPQITDVRILQAPRFLNVLFPGADVDTE